MFIIDFAWKNIPSTMLIVFSAVCGYSSKCRKKLLFLILLAISSCIFILHPLKLRYRLWNDILYIYVHFVSHSLSGLLGNSVYFLLSCLALFFIFLGVFTKLRKATISSVISVRLSVLREQLGSYCVDFHEVWYLEDFSEVCGKNSSFIKSDKNNGYFTWRPMYIFDHILLNSS
jgi:hypothetical protein